MLARRRTLNHPLGGQVDLPLLVPSFTSKGFRFFKRPSRKKAKAGSREDRRAGIRRGTFSVTHRALEWTGPYLQESLLVSAYDLFYRYFDRPLNYLKNTAIVFLASGGYELATEFDSCEPKHLPYRAESFEEEDYIAELDVLNQNKTKLPLVIANYDWGTKQQPIEAQIDAAQRIFNRYPNWLGNLILKPHEPRPTRTLGKLG